MLLLYFSKPKPAVSAFVKNHKDKVCPGVFQELADWRESFTIAEAKALCRKTNISKYSVAVMASGGLLDTLASIRAGFFPIWGCETDPTMQALWQDLTGVSSMGDAFKINAKFLRRPMLLKTGFPCVDWSAMGSQAGCKDEDASDNLTRIACSMNASTHDLQCVRDAPSKSST